MGKKKKSSSGDKRKSKSKDKSRSSKNKKSKTEKSKEAEKEAPTGTTASSDGSRKSTSTKLKTKVTVSKSKSVKVKSKSGRSSKKSQGGKGGAKSSDDSGAADGTNQTDWKTEAKFQSKKGTAPKSAGLPVPNSTEPKPVVAPVPLSVGLPNQEHKSLPVPKSIGLPKSGPPKSAALPSNATTKKTTTSKFSSTLPITFPKKSPIALHSPKAQTSTSSNKSSPRSRGKSLEGDSRLYRCLDSYDAETGFNLEDFKPWISEPFTIEYEAGDLDHIVTIDAANVPCPLHSGDGGEVTLEEPPTMKCTEEWPMEMMTVITPKEVEAKAADKTKTSDATTSGRTAATGTAMTTGHAPATGNSLVDCSGASMMSLDRLPPLRFESLSGSTQDYTPPEPFLFKKDEHPKESGEENSLVKVAGASMMSLDRLPPPRYESLSGSTQEDSLPTAKGASIPTAKDCEEKQSQESKSGAANEDEGGSSGKSDSRRNK